MNTASAELIQIISTRLVETWEAWKNKGAAAHNAVFAKDYIAVHPDGTLHARKPTTTEIADRCHSSLQAFSFAGSTDCK